MPKRVKSMVVLGNKQVWELVQTDIDRGLPAKRTHSSEADWEIIMTITQPVNSNKANKDRPKSKAPQLILGHKRLAIAKIPHQLYTQILGCNMPAMMLLFQGNISSSSINPLCPGGLGALPYLPTLGTGTCGHQELFTSSHQQILEANTLYLSLQGLPISLGAFPLLQL